MVGEWKKIDSAPKDGSHVLLFYKFAREKYVGEGWFGSSGWNTLLNNGVRATHWMELPDGPQT